MSIIPAFLLLVIIFALIVDFHRTFVFVIVTSMWLMNFNFEIKTGGLSFYTIISFVAFIIYLFNFSDEILKGSKSFPFYICLALMALSSLATNFIIGPSHLPSVLFSFFPTYINIFIYLWY